jgi:hypothetical protein
LRISVQRSNNTVSDALLLSDLDLPGASGNPDENSRQVSNGMALAPSS